MKLPYILPGNEVFRASAKDQELLWQRALAKSPPAWTSPAEGVTEEVSGAGDRELAKQRVSTSERKGAGLFEGQLCAQSSAAS